MGEITKAKLEHSWDEYHRTKGDKTEMLHKEETRTIKKLRKVVIKTRHLVISKPSTNGCPCYKI
jgi:hypothetical protein